MEPNSDASSLTIKKANVGAGAKRGRRRGKSVKRAASDEENEIQEDSQAKRMRIKREETEASNAFEGELGGDDGGDLFPDGDMNMGMGPYSGGLMGYDDDDDDDNDDAI